MTSAEEIEVEGCSTKVLKELGFGAILDEVIEQVRVLSC